MHFKAVIIPNISCQHCVKTVENEINDRDNIVSVKADQESKTLKVEWNDPQTWENIKSMLEEINYPPA